MSRDVTEASPSRLETSFAQDVQRGLRLTSGWLAAVRAWFARLTGARLGQGVLIERGAEVALTGTVARRGVIELGDRTEVCAGTLLHPRGGAIRVAADVHLGPGSVLYGLGGITIGSQTLLAPGVRIISASHTVSPRGVPIRSQPDIPQPVVIGQDVWLGTNVTVLGGVNIGDGCIVGAGAVVTADLPPYSIAYGVPARVRGQRPEATSLKS